MLTYVDGDDLLFCVQGEFEFVKEVWERSTTQTFLCYDLSKERCQYKSLPG